MGKTNKAIWNAGRGIMTVFIIGAVLLTLIPAVFINTQKDVKSELDNRALAEFPELNKDFVDGLIAYAEDRIGFREEAIAAYQIMSDKLFHCLVHPLYEYGKDGWIMTKSWDPIQTYHLDLEEGFEDRFASFLKAMQTIAKDNDADFMFLLIPNKETVYPEYLSEGYSIKNQESKSDKILRALDEQNIPYLSLLPKFMELKDEVQLYSVKQDPGHWNENGLFYGNVALVDYLRDNYDSRIAPLTIDQFEIDSQEVEYLSQSKIRIDEMTPQYSVKDAEYTSQQIKFWENTDGEDYIVYKRSPSVIENKSAEDMPKLLIIHDSYFNRENKFVGNLFSGVCLLHSSEIKNYKKTVELYKPDIVVLEATERVIGPDQSFYNNKILSLDLFEGDA